MLLCARSSKMIHAFFTTETDNLCVRERVFYWLSQWAPLVGERRHRHRFACNKFFRDLFIVVCSAHTMLDLIQPRGNHRKTDQCRAVKRLIVRICSLCVLEISWLTDWEQIYLYYNKRVHAAHIEWVADISVMDEAVTVCRAGACIFYEALGVYAASRQNASLIQFYNYSFPYHHFTRQF